MAANLFDLSNPYRMAIMKYLQELLEGRYPKYHDLLQRLLVHIVTEKDMMDFGQMFVDCYELAYHRAVNDYRKAVEPHGFRVEIKQPDKA